MTDVSAAGGILRAFSDLEGLTAEECRAIGLEESWTTAQCESLTSALGRGPAGRLTEEERVGLLGAGFRRAFVDLLCGADGFEALRGRVEALGSTANSSSEARRSRLRILRELDRIFSPVSPDAALIGAALAATAGPHLASIVAADGNAGLRYDALEILLSHPALRSLDVFRRALSDPDVGVRTLAVSGLGTMTDPSVILDLQRALMDPDHRIRGAAAGALGAQEGDALMALPDLMDRVLYDASPVVRARAATALGRIGERSGETVGCLHAAASDADATVRRNALAALVSLAPLDASDLQLLRDALSDADPGVRETAAWALHLPLP